MRKRLYLAYDLETIAQSETAHLWVPKPVAEGEKEQFPPVHTWQIVSCAVTMFTIGESLEDCQILKIGAISQPKDTEEGIVRRFINSTTLMIDKFTEHSPGDWSYVTWNGRQFDNLVMASRAFRYGVPWLPYYQSRDARIRYKTEGHWDLCDYLYDFGAAMGDRPSFQSTCLKMGMPGKLEGVNGSNVAEMIKSDRHLDVAAYNMCDSLQMALMVPRFLLLSGDIELSFYQEIQRKFYGELKTRTTDHHPYLAQLFDKINLRELMLKGSVHNAEGASNQ